MTEEAKSAEAPKVEDRDFHDVLKGLVGHMITVVNPESFEDAPVGQQLKTGFYKAKCVALGNDYLVLHTEFKKVGKSAGTEPVKQFLPLKRIKRLSLMKSERLIHI